MCIRDRYHLDGGDHDAVRQGGLGGFPRQASPPKRLNHYSSLLREFFLSSPSEVDPPFFKPVLAIRGSSGSPGSSSERNPWMAESTRETIRRKIMKKNFFLYRGRTEEPQGRGRAEEPGTNVRFRLGSRVARTRRDVHPVDQSSPEPSRSCLPPRVPLGLAPNAPSGPCSRDTYRHPSG